MAAEVKMLPTRLNSSEWIDRASNEMLPMTEMAKDAHQTLQLIRKVAPERDPLAHYQSIDTCE